MLLRANFAVVMKNPFKIALRLVAAGSVRAALGRSPPAFQGKRMMTRGERAD